MVVAPTTDDVILRAQGKIIVESPTAKPANQDASANIAPPPEPDSVPDPIPDSVPVPYPEFVFEYPGLVFDPYPGLLFEYPEFVVDPSPDPYAYPGFDPSTVVPVAGGVIAIVAGGAVTGVVSFEAF